MKRIRKIIASAIMLMMSIAVMCIGVYAVASPKVGISGSISYDVGACKVRVIGNLDGAYTDANGSGTTPVAKSATDNKGQACHYYGVHDNAQSETNMLPAWNIGSVYFKETAGGAESFVITLKVENLSAYPIKATVNNTATEALTNVTKNIVNNDAKIGVGASSEIQIKYDVTDSSKGASLTIGNELVFEKAPFVPKVDTLQYSNLLTSPKIINVFNEEPMILSETETAYLYSYMAKIQNISEPAYVTLTVDLGGFTEAELLEFEFYPLCAKQIVESGSALELIDAVDNSKIVEGKEGAETGIFEFKFLVNSEQEEVCLLIQSAAQPSIDIFERLASTISVSKYVEWKYQLVNGKVELTKYIGESVDIVVPSTFEIDGTEYPVYSLGHSNLNPSTLDEVGDRLVFATVGDDQSVAKLSTFKSLTISEGVEVVGGGACYGLSAITTLVLPNSLKAINGYAFVSVASLESLNLPSNLETLGFGSFLMCKKLKQVNFLGNKITKISEACFSGCKLLENIFLPESIIEIDDDAFANSNALKNINLPFSLQILNKSPFGQLNNIFGEECTGLVSITLNSLVPPTGLTYLPTSVENIYVPAEAVDAYKEAEGWKTYADKIKSI